MHVLFLQILPAAALGVVLNKAAPSKAVWNSDIKAAWTKAYQTPKPEVLGHYEIDDIEGTIPPCLSGTVWRNGPGKFERGGTRYEHVLDGDGLVCRFCIDGAQNRASFAGAFVGTPEYEAEAAANEILHRNTFGTQPEGLLTNTFNLVLKNPANTNIQTWGGKTLALWEAALPARINPVTLEYEAAETFDGLLPDGKLTVTSGVSEELDRSIGLGVAFTAHPREDRKRGRMVGWSWAAPLAGERLALTIREFDMHGGEVLATTKTTLPSRVAPHDFAITDSWYVFVLNAMELKLVPYVLGLSGPVGALRTTGEGVKLQLVARAGGPMAGREPIIIETDDPYFAIHHASALEESPYRLRLFTAAWPRVGQGPFLGDWGGAVPVYDDGKINPTLLLETVITVDDDEREDDEREEEAPGATMGARAERTVAVGACIDHPHVDPRFEGDEGVRYIFMSYCNEEGVSGSPPIGWCRYDRQTGELRVWKAPPRTFCEEVVVIPKEGRLSAESVEADEADVWIAAMMFDADKGRSALAILDGADIEKGPVAKLWCKGGVPHGLHGCFSPELLDDKLRKGEES